MAQGQLCDVSTAECTHATRGNHSSRGPAMPGSALELSPPSILASGGALFATSPPRLQGLPSTPLSAILRFSAMEFNCTTYRIFDATWRLLLLMCVMVSMAADSSSPVGWIIIVVAGSPLSSVEGGSVCGDAGHESDSYPPLALMSDCGFHRIFCLPGRGLVSGLLWPPTAWTHGRDVQIFAVTPRNGSV